MKKTLVALAVTAFAASASAVTVYENEGTKVDFDGSVRVLLAKESQKVGDAKSTDGHSNLKNSGSRFSLHAKHNIAEDFYALLHYETRFKNGASNTAGWGNISTDKAYVGLGGQGHLVTFGKQVVIGDEIGQAGYDKSYDVGSANVKNGFDILTTSSDSAVNYKFTGVKGLTLGANYNFANNRTDSEVNAVNSHSAVKGENAKSGFGVGAVYGFDVAEGQSLTFALGYSHDDFTTASKTKADKDGVYAGAKYSAGMFDVALDLGRGVQKIGQAKSKMNYLRAGGRVNLSDAGVYTNYSYGTVKQQFNDNYKNTAHQFMLGADYKLHKHVVTYVEGRLTKQKEKTDSTKFVKTTDKAIGVGMRVFW